MVRQLDVTSAAKPVCALHSAPSVSLGTWHTLVFIMGCLIFLHWTVNFTFRLLYLCESCIGKYLLALDPSGLFPYWFMKSQHCRVLMVANSSKHC